MKAAVDNKPKPEQPLFPPAPSENVLINSLAADSSNIGGDAQERLDKRKINVNSP